MLKKIICFFSFIALIGCGKNPNSTDSGFVTGQAVVYSKYKWNARTINIVFMDGEKERRDSVKLNAKIWTQFANIDFNFFDYEEVSKLEVLKKAHLLKSSAKISFHGSVNQSVIGQRVGGLSASMTLPAVTGDVLADRRVVLHEFGHLLGLGHEHQNANSGGIFDPKMVEQMCRDFHLDEIDCSGQILGQTHEYEALLSEYDKNSIMHYSFHGKYLKSGQDIEGASILSRTDAFYISMLYRGRFNKKSDFEEAYEKMMAQM